jgi:hypothetical protein
MGHSETLLAGAGLDQDTITRLTRHLASGDWSEFSSAEQTAFAFARKQAADPSSVTQDVDRLADYFGSEGALAVIWWLGRCHYMTRIADAFQLTLERDSPVQSTLARQEI